MIRSISKVSHIRPATSQSFIHLKTTTPSYRAYSQQQQPPSKPKKPVSPHIGFYRSFGRPVAKVFLMSIVVYQVTYWFWKKLEADEEKSDKTNEISGLENELAKLIEGKKKTS